MFYYFITGSSDVFEREASVDVSVYPQFIPLTEGEVAVHLQYPDYDRYRIDQKIRTDNRQDETPAIDVSTYRADRIMMLSDMALRRGEELLPNYKVLDAYTGVYDTSKAADTIAEANRVYTLCRNEYYRLKGLVDDASTVAGIDDVVSGADFGSIV